jgi:hypothetical protein
MDKDTAIVTQVAAKIAADLVTREATTEEKLGEFAILFTSIKDIVFEAIGSSAPVMETQSTSTSTSASSGGNLTVAGKQHGDLPDWLIKACKRDGVTKVYDNRDGLAINPKRPWFKDTDSDKAYWAPRGR